MLVLHHAYAQHARMHNDVAGQVTSLTMRREAEHAFRTQFNVSEAQYKCLIDLYNDGEVGDISQVYRCSLTPTVPGVRPEFVERYFTVPVKICCGTAMRARPLEATFYDRDACCSARHYVMKCQGACGATYHVNKKIITTTTAQHDIRIHDFYAWEGGKPPEFIANKSGRSILSTRFLTDVAFTLSRQRCVAQSKQILSVPRPKPGRFIRKTERVN